MAMRSNDSGQLSADDGARTAPQESRPRRRRWLRGRGAPLPKGVRGHAIKDGRRAARAGEYDAWSFPHDIRLGYLRRLTHERDREIWTDRSRSEPRLRSVLRRLQEARQRSRTNAVAAAGAVEVTRSRRANARERARATLEGLDTLTGLSYRHMGEAWPAEEHIEAADAPAAQPEDDGPQADTNADVDDADLDDADVDGAEQPEHPEAQTERAEPAATPGDTDPEETPADNGSQDDADARDDRSSRRVRWLGPLSGRVSPLVPTWLKIGLLVLLIAVEVPIYYKIFAPFNSHDPTLTSMFTAPIAVGMVLAPHLVGKLYRNRLQLPRERAIPYLTIVVMLLWFAAACLLGWLRQQVLLAAKPQFAPGTRIVVSQLNNYHVSWWTMTGVFACVLLLSGMIAFILGFADSHPAVAAYQAAQAESDQADEAYLEAVRVHEAAEQASNEPDDEMLRSHRREASYRRAALWSEYQAAQLAYLDSVAVEMGDPAVTQAINAAFHHDGPPPATDQPPAGDDEQPPQSDAA
jgi:hypothetical protein